ncbi:hypothetical protein EXIGLDRAFT_675922 [Exidia glandulosa HHB12029]|uniref:Uncharacterized protein n=1 Tax=Exidia glandulosa HHB12029 TaxID=1314781 RepID=A0A165H8Q7_EXIGL|nr:hypothetical protein EXIGLDRAFT_675922 [Exidia glandulosa HHB12029]
MMRTLSVVSSPVRPASSLLRAGLPTASSSKHGDENELLRAIRRITNTPRDATLARRMSASPNGTGAEEELAWTRNRVVVSVGSCVQRQWDFTAEEEDVQFACWAYVEHASSQSQAPTNASSDAANATAATNTTPRLDAATFGPFTRNIHDQQRDTAPSVRVRALFVFMRTIGRVFLESGIEYTFHIPFLTKRAWPMYPRGILIERVPSARQTGAPVLFALTDPLAEVLPVGKADSVSRSSMDLHDLSTILPPTERILTVLEHVEPLPCAIIITMHGHSRLTLWRVEVNTGASHVPELHSASQTQSQFPTSISAFSLHDGISRTLDKTVLPSSISLASLSTAVPATESQPWAAMSPRADLSLAMDRMALASRAERDVLHMSASQTHLEGGAFLEKLFSCDLAADCLSVDNASAFLFDVQQYSWGWSSRIGIHLRAPALLVTIDLKQYLDSRLVFAQPRYTPALSATPISGVRVHGTDALVVKPDNNLVCLAYGMRELDIEVPEPTQTPDPTAMKWENGDASDTSMVENGKIVRLTDAVGSSVTVVFDGGSAETRLTLALAPQDDLTRDCFAALAFALPQEQAFELFQTFVAQSSLSTQNGDDEFDIFSQALYRFLHFMVPAQEKPWANTSTSAWDIMGAPDELRDDPALAHLIQPPMARSQHGVRLEGPAPTMWHAPVLYALHLLGQDYALSTQKERDLARLAPVLIRLALGVRPVWADYWVRLAPTVVEGWSNAQAADVFDALPHLPPDIFDHIRTLFGEPQQARIRSWPTLADIPRIFSFEASTENGAQFDPLQRTRQLLQLYAILLDASVPSSTRRAEHVVRAMLAFRWSLRDVEELAVGIASPVREALRACQLCPPSDWPTEAYVLVGRPDPARMSEVRPVLFQADSAPPERRRVFQIIEDMRAGVATDVRSASGVELNIGGFTDIRFGQDRRLHEVARMLQSSSPPSVTMPGMADISEHDLAREQQQLVVKVAERTLALPLGRALFTFGTVSTVKRDAYVIPKLDFDVRIQPQNTILTAEAGKIPPESKSWAEFHNGVAAGLRISPATSAIDSSWIASNKPSDLSPQHAGFLFGLGLTGHLKSMLTWHTFSYLTPKHDLTSVGVLLGLAAANVGTANRHVTKLIAVHTPPLLPSPSVDLNVPLTTQAAGLAGLGLLYLGTGHRHMAEVTLSEIGRREAALSEPSQENREAYAVSSALAFGMIMVGSTRTAVLSPADLDFVERLRTYIHGLPPSATRAARPHFNLNVTSPAASVALGLMFLKSGRSDIAEIVALPNIAVTLDNIPPNFLFLRTLSKSLILWDDIGTSRDWVRSQVPPIVLSAMAKPHVSNEPLEVAYYNIVAGACWALGLKYAGSAQKEAHSTLLEFFDAFTQRAEQASPSFEQKIRRAAIQDGLNMIAISIGLVMAGTGDVPSLRRMRMIHGQATQPSRYGVHAAAHMAIGLLFMGGGRYTLGTSNAAIACLVAAFFPRFPRESSDNNGYVQALRHLWVLAVEPRCLIACDVDTSEVVYLPINLRVRTRDAMRTTHLVSPTLIPEVDMIQSIIIDSPRYWPLFIDVANVPRHRSALLRTQTLFVKKKTGFLSYGEDPKGSRSIVLRPGSSEASVLATPYVLGLKWTLWELHNFVKSLKGNRHLAAYLDYLCRRTSSHETDQDLHLFASAALLECLTLDKVHLLHAYLRLFKPIYEALPPYPSSLGLKDFAVATSFYTRAHGTVFSETLKAGGSQLFSASTLADVNQSLHASVQGLRCEDAFKAMLARYSMGHGIDVTRDAPKAWRMFAAYLVAENVPSASVLVILHTLAREATQRESSTVVRTLLHTASAKLQDQPAPSWTFDSLSDVVASWN